MLEKKVYETVIYCNAVECRPPMSMLISFLLYHFIVNTIASLPFIWMYLMIAVNAKVRQDKSIIIKKMSTKVCCCFSIIHLACFYYYLSHPSQYDSHRFTDCWTYWVASSFLLLSLFNYYQYWSHVYIQCMENRNVYPNILASSKKFHSRNTQILSSVMSILNICCWHIYLTCLH